MSGYTKLFSSILASTVWREDTETRIVWITLLAMAGKNGIAEGSVPGLADFARLPVPAVRKALARLSDPDPDSRSQEHAGRRIRPVDGGWLLLNHAKYRAKMGADERREYNRLKQREYRETVKNSQQMSMTVNHNNGCVDNTEAEADPEAKDQEPDQDPRADARHSHRVLTKFAHEVLDLPDASTVSEGELIDRIKDKAAGGRVVYDGTACRSALASARSARAKRRRA